MQHTLDTLFPQHELSAEEMNEIADALDRPAVKKYLHNWAIAGISALANGMPKPGEDDSRYLQREAIVKGNLEVIEKLLTIKRAPSAQS